MERRSASAKFKEVVWPKIGEAILTARPLELSRGDVGLFAEALTEVGVNLALEGKERDLLFSHSQFRARVKKGEVQVYDRNQPEGQRWINFSDADLTAIRLDRAAGMMAALGPSRFKKLIFWCQDQASKSGYPDKIGGHEGTKGRGLQQAAADLFCLAILHLEGETNLKEYQAFLARINRRLWKGFQKTTKDPELRDRLDAHFRATGLEEPTTTLASFRPTLLAGLFRFLIS